MKKATITALASALNLSACTISSSVFSLEKKMKIKPQLNPTPNSLKSKIPFLWYCWKKLMTPAAMMTNPRILAQYEYGKELCFINVVFRLLNVMYILHFSKHDARSSQIILE